MGDQGPFKNHNPQKQAWKDSHLPMTLEDLGALGSDLVTHYSSQDSDVESQLLSLTSVSLTLLAKDQAFQTNNDCPRS